MLAMGAPRLTNVAPPSSDSRSCGPGATPPTSRREEVLMAKQLLFDAEARDEMRKGVDRVANAERRLAELGAHPG